MAWRKAVTVGVAAVAALVLSGCAQSVASDAYQGEPPGDPFEVDEAGLLVDEPVAWMLDEQTLGLAVMGGSCVVTPTSIEAVDEVTARIVLERSGSWFCTTSSGWYTFEFALEGDLQGVAPQEVELIGLDSQPVTIPVG